jgi:hypothetical protein
MKNSSLFAALIVAQLIGTPQASADEIFTYQGNPWTTSNSNPSLFGSFLTASVTLGCPTTVCPDGIYQFGADLTEFSISASPTTSTTLSLNSTTPGVSTGNYQVNVVLTNGAITVWALQVYDAFPTYTEFLETSNQVDAAITYLSPGQSNAAVYSFPGNSEGWAPAPGPIPGAGWLSYLALGLLGLGTLFSQRRPENTTMVSALALAVFGLRRIGGYIRQSSSTKRPQISAAGWT